MKEFNELKDKLKKMKNKKINLLNFNENENKDEKIEDFTIDYELIDKDDYSFRLFTYKRLIPVKNDNFKNKLDYTMKEFYFLKLYINDNEDLLEITIDNKDNKDDIHNLYIYYLDKIKNLQINEVFSYFSDILESR